MDMTMLAPMTIYVLFYSSAYHSFLRVPRPNSKDVPMSGNGTSPFLKSSAFLDPRCSVRSLFTVERMSTGDILPDGPHRTILSYSEAPLMRKSDETGTFLIDPTRGPNMTAAADVQTSKFILASQLRNHYLIYDSTGENVLTAVSEDRVEFRPISILNDRAQRKYAEFKVVPTTKTGLRMLICNIRKNPKTKTATKIVPSTPSVYTASVSL